MNEKSEPVSKAAAHQFFRQLERYLNRAIPAADVVKSEIAAVVKEAKALPRGNPGRENSFPEGAFLNHYVLEAVYQFLRTDYGLSADAARLALLSESYRTHPGISSGSPVRPGAHPFRKITGTANEIMDIWRGRTSLKPLAQNACPDLAIGAPAPITVVFEAKYHSVPRIEAAERALVESIYQAFFYLALPPLERTKRHAAWNYTYACVLVYDVSANGAMLQAWKSFPKAVKSACWKSANLRIVVLPDGAVVA